MTFETPATVGELMDVIDDVKGEVETVINPSMERRLLLAKLNEAQLWLHRAGGPGLDLPPRR